MTTKYFCDAVGAKYAGSLTYRRIENIGDMKKHPTVAGDVKEAAMTLLTPLLGRRKVYFGGRAGDCRCQMAAGFARFHAGDRFDIVGAGIAPAEAVHPLAIRVMQEKGIDLDFIVPRGIVTAVAEQPPDQVVWMDDASIYDAIDTPSALNWQLPYDSESDIDTLRNLRDRIEARVADFCQTADG